MATIKVTATATKTTCAATKVQTKLAGFKITKFSAPKRKTKKYLQALERPLPPPGRTYAVKILEDGLLGMDKIPDYLVAAVKRNMTESPLLRLPLKARRMIWEYAIGGLTVEIRLRSSATDPLPPLAASTTQYFGKVLAARAGRKKVRTAFHLPEVCRQIYSETATLGYCLNRFVFPGEMAASFGKTNGPDGALENWAIERIPAQLKAITSIRPHWIDVIEYLDKRNMRTFKQLYPSLKYLRVPSKTVNIGANRPSRGDSMRTFLRQQAKESIAERIRRQEGDDVEAVFHD